MLLIQLGYIIGLLGVAPIVIGVKKLVEFRKKNESDLKSKEAAQDKKKKIPLSKNDLVESLAQITNRKIQELEQSLARLQDSDLKKINELCRNYNKLQHYSKLITKEEFRNEIQKELGRELRSHSLDVLLML